MQSMDLASREKSDFQFYLLLNNENEKKTATISLKLDKSFRKNIDSQICSAKLLQIIEKFPTFAVSQIPN